jgi:uncharacterized protein (DUF362 family)
MDVKLSRVSSSGDVKEDIRRVLAELGGLDQFVQAGQSVLVKPNFNTADEYPASSDPEFLAALVDVLREQGASRVAVGESSTYFLKTGKVMDKWGIEGLKKGRPWLEVINFDEGEWVSRHVPSAKYQRHVSIPACLSEFDRLVYAPCLKTHSMTRYTGALKLTVGLMKPSERLGLHILNVQEKVGEINAVVEPDLIVMDARKCFISGGPMNGPVREPGVILAGDSRLAIDEAGLTLIQSFEGNSLSDVDASGMPQFAAARAVGVK